jgi:adenylyltransferase/sulfurtransferase
MKHSHCFLLFDALTFEFNELKINKNNDCVSCGENPSITKLIDYKQFCGVESVNEKISFTELDATELQKKLENDSSPTIIDVREDFELEISRIEGSLHIPNQTQSCV